MLAFHKVTIEAAPRTIPVPQSSGLTPVGGKSGWLSDVTNLFVAGGDVIQEITSNDIKGIGR